MQLYVCACIIAQSHNLVQSCPCACTIAHNYAVMRLYIRALVHALLINSCTCAGTLLCSYALVPLYMHNCTHLCSCTVMQSCPCTCTIAHTCACVLLRIRALVRSCIRACTILCSCTVMQLYGCTLVPLRACAKTGWVGRAQKRSLAVPACIMVMPSRTLPTCFPCRTCQEPREAERPVRHG